MVDLILRPSGLEEKYNRLWALQLRYHEGPTTDYITLARVTDEVAQQIMKAGATIWLFGEPDWNERRRCRDLEKARALHEEAEKIENQPAAREASI